MKIDKFVNSIDSDEMAHHEPPHLDLQSLTLLHSERPKLYTILAFLSAIGINSQSGVTCLKFAAVNFVVCVLAL